MLYLPRGCGSALLCNAELPLIITEGEFRTLALWRLAKFGVQNDPRFLPVGIAGFSIVAAPSVKPLHRMANGAMSKDTFSIWIGSSGRAAKSSSPSMPMQP